MELRIIRVVEKDPVDTKKYSLSDVTEITGISGDQIRNYVEEGFIDYIDQNKEGFTFSYGHVKRLLRIRRLAEQLDVNLQGIEVILNMRDKIKLLQREVEKMQKDHEEEIRDLQTNFEMELNRLYKKSAKKIDLNDFQ